MKTKITSFLYLSYHSSTAILSPKEKLKKYAFVYDILKEISKKHTVNLIDFSGGRSSFVENNIQYHFRKKTNNNRWNFHLKTHLLIRKLKPTIIYFCGIRDTYLLLFLLPILKEKSKVIVQHHAEKVPANFVKRKILSVMDKYVSKYIFTSTDLANDWVEQGVISSKAKIFAQPELSTHFTFDDKKKKEKDLFLWVARLNKNKDPLTIVNAFISYLKINNKARLKMFYTENNLEEEIKEILYINKITTQIELKKEVAHHELEEWYQRSEFFLLGSYYEGGSAALIEALACNCIPIVSNIPANRAIVKDGECGLLFKPGSEVQLLACLKSVQSLDKLLLRKRIANHFNEKLSFKALSNGLVTIINSL